MKSGINNIFENVPDKLKNEVFESLIDNKNFKMERIISEAHASPPGFWYDQEQNEFVLLLQGSAQLSFQDDENLTLKPGDYIIIRAHKKHRIEWTDNSTKTIWLAIHY